MQGLHYLLYIWLGIAIEASHYRGGTFTWKPVSPQIPNQNPVSISFTQRHAWRRGYYYCNQTTIDSGGTVGAGDICCLGTQCGSLSCFPSTAVPCTDFSVSQDTSAGQGSLILNLSPNIKIALTFTGGDWITLQNGGGRWAVTTQISTYMRADGHYNTAPISAMVPVKLLRQGFSYTWLIPTADTDGDTVKCRWASATATVPTNVVADECAGICNTFPGATLNSSSCMMTYTASTVGFWAVSLMMEDYEFTWQTSPLSSTPLQFIVEVYILNSPCIVGPSYTGARPAGACVGVDINQIVVEQAIFTVGCSGATLTDVITTSPPGMTRGTITQSTSNPLEYTMSMTWTPPASAWGSNLVCYTPIDSLGQQGNTQCVTYLVAVTAPELIYTSYVNGSMSPIGTVMSTQNVWRVECTKAVNRPSTAAYIRFYQSSTATQVYALDASTDTTHVFYSNFTLIFFTNYAWTPGQSYYILFDNGVVTGTEFCGPQSKPILDPTFWPFNIFNSVAFSNLTGMTTSSTTTIIPNITTPAISTTTANPAITTTGITVPSSTTPYTGIGTSSTVRTTTTTSTSTTSITSTTSTTTTTTMPAVQILQPSDIVKKCEQPVIIGTLLSTTVVGAICLVIYGVFMARIAASM
ncbi:unnamed protein product [Rotaria sordida]|uniref:Uncharacterized protein n=4 Tax=Rotaria sordida TaxID=392033 RepID=A0A815LGS2_9BILA|nr:unnamed protein product [Rotaria sordida]